MHLDGPAPNCGLIASYGRAHDCAPVPAFAESGGALPDQRLADGCGAGVAALDALDPVVELVVVRVRLRLALAGMAVVLSANTTTCPTLRPSVISIRPPPTAPVFTVVTVGLEAPDASALTVPVPVPVGVSAETGTVTTPVREATGIDTDALAPLASNPSGSLTEIVVV